MGLWRPKLLTFVLMASTNFGTSAALTRCPCFARLLNVAMGAYARQAISRAY